MYKVVHKFYDLKDDRYLYKVGDEYPRKGYSPTPNRIKSLSTRNNKAKKVLIKADK